MFLALLAFTYYRSEALASSRHGGVVGPHRLARRLDTPTSRDPDRVACGTSFTSTSRSTTTTTRSTTTALLRLPFALRGGSRASTALSAAGVTPDEPNPFDTNSNNNNNNNKLHPQSARETLPFITKNDKNGRVPANGATVTTLPLGSVHTVKACDDDVVAEYVAETKLPTDVGQFQLRAYRVPGAPLGQEPCVIYARDQPPFGDAANGLAQHVPVRIHDQCLTSEVFRSQRCDCKEQLHMALLYIQKHGGCIIYLQQEGRGIGLANKVAAYALQDNGLDTVDANLHLGFPEDSREYGVVKAILRDMQIGSIQLMTNNPRKVERMARLGIVVDRTLPMVVPQTNPYNHKYMETKKTRMNHENLATLLAQDPNLPPAVTQANAIMAPRKHLADQYINNGTEMTANAVQVSLMVEDEADGATDVQTRPHEQGVRAAEDGYCFGKQSVIDAIASMKRGEMVVVVDDMDRENEGDFIMAADQCTELDMARIVRYSSGVVCIAMEGSRLEELKLPPMVTNNQDPKGTAFSVTVDATKKHGITTGISASDRATTINLLANPSTTAIDFHRPGHIFPLRAQEGGVLARDGHTEAAVDLSRLAGRNPAGVLCEIVSEDNPTEMMRLPEIRRFCKRHGFVLTSIVDIAQYRRETEQQAHQ